MYVHGLLVDYGVVLHVIILEYFKTLLKPSFSEVGTRMRTMEEASYIHFLDFLEECEGMAVTHSYAER